MKRVTGLFLLLCSFPFAARAQQALTGTITGTVLDASSAAVAGAQITAHNKATGLERSTTSGELGLYTVPALPVGEYDVTAKAQGFSETKVEGVRVGVGQLLTLDLKLTVGAVAQAVTVEAQAAAIETTRTSVASSVSSGQISNLGLNGRDFLNFVLLTPGVTRDPRLGDLSFGGQRGTLNNLQVDGADNNNSFFGQALGRTGSGRAPYQFSVDSVEEFQINTSSYSAEFGRAGGAVINVVTKSGTNDFHGSGFWFYRDRYLNANTHFNNANNRVRQPFHANQFGATVGGPVVKNKDFFFFNYDGQRRNTPSPVFLGKPIPSQFLGTPLAQRLLGTLTSYVVTFNQDVYLAKNDWQINDKHRLSVRYNHQGFTGENLESSGAQSALERSGTSRVKTDTLAASLSSVLTNRLLNDVRFQYLRDEEPGVANGNVPETILSDGGTTVMQFGQLNFSPRFTNIKGAQWIDNLTYSMGRHILKGGVDINHNSVENFFPGQRTGSYTFTSFADFFSGNYLRYQQAFPGEGTAGFTTKPNFTDLGFYAQDEFRVTSRLTLNLGLRYDLSLWTKPPVRNPDPQLAAIGVDTSYLENDKNNWGPRFGFAYRPLNSNKLVVRGGYGVNFGRSPMILMSTAYNQNGVSVSTLTFTPANGPVYPNNFSSRPTGLTTTPSIYAFERGYRLPLVLQGSLGVEYELHTNTTLGLSYLTVRGTHLSRTRDINFFPAQAFPVDVPGLGTRTQLRYLARPATRFARASIFDSGADSIYHGLALTLKRRFATRYQVGLSYTWSHVIDSVPDFTSVVVGTDDSKNPQFGLDPNSDRGSGGADQRHRAVTNFVYDLDYYKGGNKPLKYIIGGWTLSGIITAQTGQPFSATVGGDPNGDGNANTDRVPGEGRNVYHGPTIAVWDLRIGKSIPLYERVKLNLGLDLFNAWNHANYAASDIRPGKYSAAFNSTTRAYTFTPITGATAFGTYSRQNTFDPRILQVSAKIVF